MPDEESERVVHKPTHGGYTDRVAESELRLPPSNVYRVVVGTLQPRVLATGQRSYAQFLLPRVNQKLDTAPPLGRA